MTTIGYIYYECPKCKEVLSQFSELSSFTPAGTARSTDGADETVMSWESGYLKQCPTCKHADLPSNFKTVSPEGGSKPFDLDSGNFRSIKFSAAWATRNSVSSSHGRPIACMEMGKPLSV